jgi:hypothetical protein
MAIFMLNLPAFWAKAKPGAIAVTATLAKPFNTFRRVLVLLIVDEYEGCIFVSWVKLNRL